jgi:hypothetical protein
MAHYENNYEDAVEFVRSNAPDRPGIFARVRITFGEKFMIDYGTSSIPSNIELLEDLRSQVDTILSDRVTPQMETDEVTFDRTVRGLSFGQPATYSLYKGPSKSAAIAFLEKKNITEQSYFVGVKTPEGTFCKDRMGLFDAPTANWPND